jgi:hypothetical protein
MFSVFFNAWSLQELAVRIMPSRLEMLQAAVAGYQKTGMALVGYQNGAILPAGWNDDVGMYYVVPKLMSWFHLSLNIATDVFLWGIIVGAYILGVVGILLLCKTIVGKVSGIIVLLLLTLLSIKHGDVYVMNMSAVLAVVPYMTYVLTRMKFNRWTWVLTAVAGLLLGYAEFVRAGSARGSLLLILVLLLGYKLASTKLRAALIAVFLVSFFIPKLHFGILFAQRDAYVKEHATTEVSLTQQHPLWHSIYIGLGYLPNSYGLEYRDEIGFAAAEKVSPGVVMYSAEYESILKTKSIQFVKDHPGFFVKTLIIKAKNTYFTPLDPRGVSIMALFFLLGIIGAIWARPKAIITWAYAVGALVYGLIGLIVVPFPYYIFGYMAVALLYAIIGINKATEKLSEQRRKV